MKLGKFEFDCLHRMHELPQGVHDWYEILKKDVADAEKTCPYCQGKKSSAKKM